jgi:hypothetical protein
MEAHADTLRPFDRLTPREQGAALAVMHMSGLSGWDGQDAAARHIIARREVVA